MSGPLLASVDLGGTKTTVSLCAPEGILARVRQTTTLEGDESVVPIQVDELIGTCAEMMGEGRESVAAVGISSPGPFGKADGCVSLVAPNMCGGLALDRGLIPNQWTAIPLVAELSKLYEHVYAGNDAVTGAAAERRFGAGRGFDDLVYVTWSTGIGTGAYVDGRLIRGKNGNAPHGGHVCLVDGGPQCGCGDEGHLEALASGTAIARDYGKKATAADVLDKYRKGDKKAKEVVEKAARFFAKGLASINAVLDTRLFIIGGGVFLTNQDLLLPIVSKEFQGSFPIMADGVDIVPSELGEFLGEMAGLSLVMPEEWEDDWDNLRPWEGGPEWMVLD